MKEMVDREVGERRDGLGDGWTGRWREGVMERGGGGG